MELIYPQRPLHWSDIIYELQEILTGMPEVYLVGGMVRDAYRDVPFKDIDIVCAKDSIPLARKIANALQGSYYPMDKEREVGRVFVDYQGESYIIDVSIFRGENLLADLEGRDFTINAMAVPLESDLQGIYDPLGGIKDWQDKVLRRCTPDSIYDDPVRALRAVRMSLTLSLAIEPETRHDIRNYGTYIQDETSAERVRDEFFKLLGGKRPHAALAALETLGLLKIIVPELAHLSPQVWRDTLQSIDKLNTLLLVISYQRDDNIAANVEFGTFVYLLDRFRRWLLERINTEYPDQRNHKMLLVFAMLTHLCDETEYAELAANRAIALKLSSQEVQSIRKMLKHMHRPLKMYKFAQLEPRQIYRYWNKTRQEGIDACLLGVSVYLAEQGIQLQAPVWTAILQTIEKLFDGYDTAMNATPIITGDDLMATFDLEPGRQIGQILGELREAAALGEIATAEDALSMAKRLLDLDGHNGD